MNKYNFERSIVKLERAFKPLSKNSDERDEKVEAYYDRLKFTDEYVLNKAIVWLQDNYEFRNFPLIADILKAIQGVKESMRKEYHPGEECEYCSGTGWIISGDIDNFGRENSMASPCNFCEDGRAVKKACAIKDKQTGRRYRAKQAREIVKELTENLPDIKKIELPEGKEDFLS